MVDASQFLDQWALPLLALVLAGGIAYLVRYSGIWLDGHAKFLSAQTRQKIAALETQALQEGANYIIANATKAADKEGQLQVDGLVARTGAQIALNHAAGFLASHGMSPEQVSNQLLAKLPPIQIITGPAVPTIPVSTSPLGAIKP